MSNWLLVALVVVMIVIYSLVYTYPKVRRAYKIAHNSKIHTGRFWLGKPSTKPFKLLVLGDSAITGQGITRFIDSAGGRFACMLGTMCHVEYLNQAGMGKWIGDIDHEQIAEHWDLAILVLGSNDLLHSGDLADFQRSLADLLGKLKTHSNYIITVGPGAVSKSKIFPWWYRLMLKKREQKYATAIQDLTKAVGGHYFDPLTAPQLFLPLSKDGLHLSVRGNHSLAGILWQEWLECSAPHDNAELKFSNAQLEAVTVKS